MTYVARSVPWYLLGLAGLGLACMVLVGCTRSDDPATDPLPGSTTPRPAPARFSVGGSVSGLTGTLVLHNNGADPLTLSANGAFAFSARLTAAETYSVSVASQPTNMTCAVTNASGVVRGTDVTDVAVTCSPTQTPSASGAPDPAFGNGGKVTTDFSGAPPATARVTHGDN